jgi:molybdate/tungstate transport system substrate-binding protein
MMIAACSVAVTLGAQSPRKNGSSDSLHVCHAGSLLAAFTHVEDEFRKQNPGVTVVDTSGGSVDLARRFAAGRLECDVIAPADHLVIETMLRPARLVDFTIVFATGRMVLAYVATDAKASALKVTSSFDPPTSVPRVTPDWHEVLTAPGVRISGAHPFMDPGGYRAHMIFELAQSHYKVPGLYNSLLQHYQVNVADPSAATPAPVLGKDFNFQFTYEHTAAAAAKRDPSYRYAMLPEEIDLSSSKQDLYPSGVTIPGLGIQGSMASVTIPASPVAWGLTIASNSRNRDKAIAFVERLLGPLGRKALTTNGPQPLPRARVSRSDYQRLPETLQSLTSTN